MLSWFAVQVRLELAKAYLSLGDVRGAKTLCREAEDVLRRRPALGTLVDEARELRARLSTVADESSGWASTLTAAELRLLPLLTTHLSFREIAERLFVSRNTVKTQAISVYRKLDASSRSEAIERAVELGLVDAAPASRGRFHPLGMMPPDAERRPMRVQPVEEYKLTLRRLAMRDDRYIDALLSEDRANATLAGIDPRSHALARIAALIAVDAAPPSYMSAVEAGLEAGASYDEIVGTLIAVMPIVGVARVVSAAPEPRPRARVRRRRRARDQGLAQPADRVADQLRAEHEQQHGHDRRVVRGHPRLHLVEDRRGPRPEQEVDRDRGEDGERADEDEDRERDGLFAA